MTNDQAKLRLVELRDLQAFLKQSLWNPACILWQITQDPPALAVCYKPITAEIYSLRRDLEIHLARVEKLYQMVENDVQITAEFCDESNMEGGEDENMS